MKLMFWKKSLEEQLADNEKFIPYEILQQKNKNTDIQTDECKTYQKDDYLVKEYTCGCKFETKIKSFGFSNHWCEQHAKNYPMSKSLTKERKESEV